MVAQRLLFHKKDVFLRLYLSNMKLTTLFSLCLIVGTTHAQQKTILTFGEYLNNVKTTNIDLLAEQYNVDIADARVQAAGVFPDPELSVEYGNNQNWNLRMGYGVDVELKQQEMAAIHRGDPSAEGQLKEALIGLAVMQGDKTMTLPDSLAGTLTHRKQTFDLQELIAGAQNNRADLQAALRSKELSANNLRLVKANRSIDLDVSVGGSYSGEARNEIAPAPAFKGINAGISIPLKLSNTNKGELRAARLAAQQSEARYNAVELQIAAEVARAYNSYTVACHKVEQWGAHIAPEEREAYCEACYECAVALVELERACGTEIGFPLQN